jgi:hypothetical protein
MAQPTADKQHLYYARNNITPTYAAFAQESDLNNYALNREKFFTEKLRLPQRFFRGAHLAEFGPDCGENALVFAKWGALLTLIEPNPKSWVNIQQYFSKFGLTDKLISLEKTDLENFNLNRRFDIINAEGFIYTIPESVWINQFDRHLAENGFFIISYLSSYGYFLEILLKVLYHRVKNVLHLTPAQSAIKLFQTKWDSIPHTRSIENWAMDSLESPFVRISNCYDLPRLYRQLLDKGFVLYSGWPNTIDLLNVYWHKKQLSDEVQLQHNIDFVNRSSLSFAFDRKLFITSPDPGTVREINGQLMQLLVNMDRLIDDFNGDSIRKCRDSLTSIRSFLTQGDIYADSPKDRQEALALVHSVECIFNFLAKDDLEALINFCHGDEAFITSWGLPSQYAVFQKRPRV